MTSISHVVATFLVLATLNATSLFAQSAATAPVAPQVELSPAEKAFNDITGAFQLNLLNAGAFRVDVKSDWTYSGVGETTKGTNLISLAVETGGKYRIEAGSVAKGKAQYLCVSDGKQVTRLHASGKLFSKHPVLGDRRELEDDALTQHTLSGTGVELLLRSDLREKLISEVAEFELVGEEQLADQKVTHLQLILADQELTVADKRRIDAWFTQGEKPLLVKLTSSVQINISESQTAELTAESQFDWKLGGPLPPATFQVSLPAGAREVDDLLAALQSGDIRELLGKQAPALELSDLDGNLVRLDDYRGKKVVVLVFWASWCAPSVNRMDTFKTFVAQAEENGAVVLAINFGEAPELVRESIQARSYPGTVLLDPDTKSMAAFRYGELPMTVLIGKDGTVQSYHSGSTDEARQRVREDTAALLQGKQLVPTQNR